MDHNLKSLLLFVRSQLNILILVVLSVRPGQARCLGPPNGSDPPGMQLQAGMPDWLPDGVLEPKFHRLATAARHQGCSHANW